MIDLPRVTSAVGCHRLPGDLFMRYHIIVLAAFAGISHARPADTAFVNGKVWTGDPARPEARAVAVANGRVVAVGTDAEVRAAAGPAAKVVDLGGRRVVPG